MLRLVRQQCQFSADFFQQFRAVHFWRCTMLG
jgi:hypothetical protein